MVICEYVQFNPWFFHDYERKRRRDTYITQTPVKLTVCMPYKFFLRFIKLPNIPW